MASPAARHGESSRRKFTSYHSHAHVKPGYKLRGYDHAKDRTAGLAAKPNENRVPGGHPAAPSCGGLIIRLRLVGGSKLSNGMDLLLWNIVSNGNRVSGKRLAVDFLVTCPRMIPPRALPWLLSWLLLWGLAVDMTVGLAVGFHGKNQRKYSRAQPWHGSRRHHDRW